MVVRALSSLPLARLLVQSGHIVPLVYIFGSVWPTKSMRDWDSGTRIGGSQVMVGRVEQVGSSWDEEIRRARRPLGVRSLAAVGRTFGGRSTARRVTTSKVDGGRVSARVFCILMSVNVRARATSRRKVAFF